MAGCGDLAVPGSGFHVPAFVVRSSGFEFAVLRSGVPRSRFVVRGSRPAPRVESSWTRRTPRISNPVPLGTQATEPRTRRRTLKQNLEFGTRNPEPGARIGRRRFGDTD